LPVVNQWLLMKEHGRGLELEPSFVRIDQVIFALGHGKKERRDKTYKKSQKRYISRICGKVHRNQL